MDTESSCDQFTSRKCLVSDNEIISQNKNNPQTSTFTKHSAVWQLMNGTLRRCLCTFIIYYTTLRNKTTADDKLMLSQLCTLCNDTFTRPQPASSPTFLLGERQKDPEDPDQFQQLSEERQQLCLHKALKQYTLKCCLVCAHARSRSTNPTPDTEHHTCSRPCFHPASRTCIKSQLISHRGRYPCLAAHVGQGSAPLEQSTKLSQSHTWLYTCSQLREKSPGAVFSM